MAGFLMPSAGRTLGAIGGKVGGTANALASQSTPGVGNVRATLTQLLNNPDFAMPGGGSFNSAGGPLGFAEKTGEPAATLPLFQAEPGRLMGLAGAEGGASRVGAEQSTLEQGLTGAVSQQLTQLLQNLGFTPAIGNVAGGTFGALSSILGI